LQIFLTTTTLKLINSFTLSFWTFISILIFSFIPLIYQQNISLISNLHFTSFMCFDRQKIASIRKTDVNDTIQRHSLFFQFKLTDLAYLAKTQDRLIQHLRLFHFEALQIHLLHWLDNHRQSLLTSSP